MAKRRTLKCPKCDRKFSMAAHLARHLGTIHKRKPKKRVAKKRTVRTKAKRGRPRGMARKTLKLTRAKRIGTRHPVSPEIAGIITDLRAYQGALEAELSAARKAMKALSG